MKNLKGKKGKRILAAALAVSVFFLFVAPHQLSAKDNPCFDALVDCLIDAGATTFVAGLAGAIAALPSGLGSLIAAGVAAIVVGTTSVSACIAGYDFCLRYVKI